MFFSKRSTQNIPAAPFDRTAGIELSSASVQFEAGDHKIAVLSDISLTLNAPSTAVLGLNGSGKSTLFKLLNGLETPTAGSVRVGGLAVSEHVNLLRQKVGFLFANPAAQLVMPTGLEDVELSLRASISERTARTAKAQEILMKVGMGHRATHSVYDLSGGERQLIALATVLAVEPEILLLDEPTTLLDLRNRIKLMELLKTLDQQLIISTHDLDLATTCKQAVVIHNGRVLAQGASVEVIKKYQEWCTSGFPGEPC